MSPLTMRIEYFRRTFKAMGSPCEVQLFVSNERDARRAADAVVADVERLEQRYSRYRDSSLLSSINRVAAAGGSVDVDDETSSLLNYAATCHRESDGLFDVTSGLLRRAWRFSEGRLPDPREIDALRPRIGWEKLRWTPPTLSFPIAGMEIDFGGVVKEYAADRAAAVCRQYGVASAMVNLGGDISIVGPRPDGDAWRIGLQHPRARGEVMNVVGLKEGGLATSGDYERCVIVDGRRYGHILNPHTGWPVHHMAAVSVVGSLCVVAGSASTIAMLKDEEGPAWLARLGLPHFWVTVDGKTGGSLA